MSNVFDALDLMCLLPVSIIVMAIHDYYARQERHRAAIQHFRKTLKK